jgi:hypothetical protein
MRFRKRNTHIHNIKHLYLQQCYTLTCIIARELTIRQVNMLFFH